MWHYFETLHFSHGLYVGTVVRIFEDIKRDVKGGACATYIPALASADPSLFAVSICTVDGQQFSYGDVDSTFSIQASRAPFPLPHFFRARGTLSIFLQSCVKPLMYAVAVEDRGLSLVHRHVGFEPSGLAFNEVRDVLLNVLGENTCSVLRILSTGEPQSRRTPSQPYGERGCYLSRRTCWSWVRKNLYYYVACNDHY
jgi:glutaminase